MNLTPYQVKGLLKYLDELVSINEEWAKEHPEHPATNYRLARAGAFKEIADLIVYYLNINEQNQ